MVVFPRDDATVLLTLRLFTLRLLDVLHGILLLLRGSPSRLAQEEDEDAENESTSAYSGDVWWSNKDDGEDGTETSSVVAEEIRSVSESMSPRSYRGCVCMYVCVCVCMCVWLPR